MNSPRIRSRYIAIFIHVQLFALVFAAECLAGDPCADILSVRLATASEGQKETFINCNITKFNGKFHDTLFARLESNNSSEETFGELLSELETTQMAESEFELNNEVRLYEEAQARVDSAKEVRRGHPKMREPGTLEFDGFKIGDVVDRTLFIQDSELFLWREYMDQDGSTLGGLVRELPISLWTRKSDSSFQLCLLDSIVLQIIISNRSQLWMDSITTTLERHFNSSPIRTKYQEPHPLQSYLTFADLYTWQSTNVVVEAGYGYLARPQDPKPSPIKYSLIYTDMKKVRDMITSSGKVDK